MKKTNILFYCSWGGLGHIARASSIISKLPSKGIYTVATPERWPFSKPSKNFKYIKLPTPKSRIRLKDDKLIVQNYTPGANDIKGYQKHLHAFVNALKNIRPQVVVVDNPAEIAIFTKILGYKTVVVYESLETNELRWKLAWKNVDKVLAPYPKEFLKKAKFPYLKNTFCAGGFSRYDGIKTPSQAKAKKKLGLKVDKKYLLLTMGKGRKSENIIKKICQYTKGLGYEVLVLYPEKNKFITNLAKSLPHLKQVSGVYDEMNLYLSSADLIVTGAGYGSVMEACYFRKPTIAIPLERIYNEQILKAKILSEMGAVVSIKPSELNSNNLRKALKKLANRRILNKMEKAQRKVINGRGAERAAKLLTKMAEENE